MQKLVVDKTTGSIWIDLATKKRLEKEKKEFEERNEKMKNERSIKRESVSEPWRCLRCGKCCKFIVIPVQRKIDLETEAYLIAHGLKYNNGKLIIPAVCKYLGSDNQCRIYAHRFPNCRLGGKKECKEAKKIWYLLKQKC